MLTIREVIKLCFNALLQRLKKHRGNWDQNDPSADDYIKNRPFYTDETNHVVKLDKKYLPDLGLAPVATSGSYDDLEDTPTIYTDVVRYGTSQSLSAAQKTQARTNIGAGIGDVLSEDLATIATSGSYNDLGDQPFGMEIRSEVLNGMENISRTMGSVSSGNGTSCYLNKSGVTFTEEFVVGQKYKVIINGQETILEAKQTNFIGNRKIHMPDSTAPDNPEAYFYIELYLDLSRYVLFLASSWYGDQVTVSIYKYSETINLLDEKFIPDTIARTEDIPSIEGLATEEYVDTKVADLVNAAPETLDTLKELSTALGDDPNFATTVLTQLGNKADKDDIPTIDATLTVEGAAADAKAVGDALAETDVWYVHATANDDGSFSLDKTYDEIIAAYDAGRKVQCEMRFAADAGAGAYIFDLIAFGPYVPDVYDGDTVYNGALFVLWMQNRMMRMLVTTDNQVMMFQTNRFQTEGELQIRYGNELMYAGHMGVDVDIDLNIPINAPKDYIALRDHTNGYTYLVGMVNGTLVSTLEISELEIASYPNTMAYTAGDELDLTGLVVNAVRYDGSKSENIQVTHNAPSPLSTDVTSVTLSYNEFGKIYTVELPITVAAFTEEAILVDYEYTDNGDGTYNIKEADMNE